MIEILTFLGILWIVIDVTRALRRLLDPPAREPPALTTTDIPPLHYNCRCVMVMDDPHGEVTEAQRAAMKEWFDENSIRLDPDPSAPYEPPLERARNELARLYGCPPRIAFDVAEQLRHLP